ncbi:uncharacterized protein VP01_1519g1, partial [Puccinia sorghi]
DLEKPSASEAEKEENFESQCKKAAENFGFFSPITMSRQLNKLNSHLANMKSVGLKVRIPEKAHIHKHLLPKQIIQKIPESLSHFKDMLSAKRPLTLIVVKEHLQAKVSVVIEIIDC